LEVDNKKAQSETCVSHNSQTKESSAVTHSHSHIQNASVFEPLLSSSVEDINKYYKPDLLYRLTGIDFNEVIYFILKYRIILFKLYYFFRI
jgi:hypothetical protein